MNEQELEVWAFTAKQHNPRSEMIAVGLCQEGIKEPLALVLAEYGHRPEFISFLCSVIKTPTKLKKKLPKSIAIGYEIEKRMHERPGQKELIVQEVATGKQIVGGSYDAVEEKTAENYHDRLLRTLKEHGATRAELARFRELIRDPTVL